MIDDSFVYVVGARVAKYLQDFHDYQLNAASDTDSATTLFSVQGNETILNTGGKWLEDLDISVTCKDFSSDTFSSETFSSETNQDNYQFFSGDLARKNISETVPAFSDSDIKLCDTYLLEFNNSSTVLIGVTSNNPDSYLKTDIKQINIFAELLAQNILFNAGLKPKAVNLDECPFRLYLTQGVESL